MGAYASTQKDNNEEFKKYGWVRDIPDHRDIHRTRKLRRTDAVIDLRSKCPEIYNQGKLGSCTANAIAAAYQFDELKQNETNTFIPSRLFIYYNERDMEGSVNYDSGAQIRDGIKSINKVGVCPETEWPYDISTFTTKPANNCYETAKNHKSVKYERLVHEFEHLQDCLASGYPFVFGFAVYESFESPEVAKTGIMPIPNKNEKLLGGHAVMAVGYDDNKGAFIVRNSWGPEWGDKGYFYMPYEFMISSDYCSDFWTVQTVKDN